MQSRWLIPGIAAVLAVFATATATAAGAAPGGPTTAPAPLRFSYPHRAEPSGSSVLYSQVTDSYDSGLPSSTDPDNSSTNAVSADDFVVTNAGGWIVSAFNFAVASFGTPPSDPTYTVNVYADASGVPDATDPALCSADAVPGTLNSDNTALNIALPAACSLPAGHYWVTLQANGFNMIWAGFAPDPTPNVIAQWKNPGNGYQTGCTDWSDSTACSATATALGFEVIGAQGSAPTCAAGGICLSVTLGSDTSSGACGTTDSLIVPAGTQVNYCYTVTNQSGVALPYQSLSDNINGSIFELMNQSLADGASYQYNRIATVGATETNTATWTAQTDPPGYTWQTTQDDPPISDRVFCDGFDGVACGSGGGTLRFIDITASGTALDLADDGSAAVDMPWSFTFYGLTSNALCVDNNGLILFGTTACPTSGLYSNATLPSADLEAAAIMPQWDDFDTESGAVYYATLGSAPNRSFVVEWANRVHYAGDQNSDGATFEVIFDEATGLLSFEYADVAYSAIGNTSDDPDECTHGVCATIGVQRDVTLANQFSFNAASIGDYAGIDWTPTTVQAFTASDTVTVTRAAPVIVLSPPSITVQGSTTAPAQTILTVGNAGNLDLTYTLDEAPSNAHFPSTPGTRRYVIPAGDPRAPAMKRAPAASVQSRKPVPLPSTVSATLPGFAVVSGSSASAGYVSLDVTAPGALNEIPVTGDLGTMWGGAFLGGDFSREYLLGDTGFETIDTATGAVTLISASTGGGDVWGMTADPSSNTLYGVGPSTSQKLYTIDAATGATTDVAPISGDAAGDVVNAIAINAAGQMYGVDKTQDCLLAIDETSGDSQCIGAMGFDTEYVGSLAFDLSTGVLYYAGADNGAQTVNIYTVDSATGAMTLLGKIGAFHDESNAQLDGLALATAPGPCTNPADVPWLSINGASSGTVPPGNSVPVPVAFNPSGLSAGVYDATICARSNDPARPTVAVPVEYTVGGTEPRVTKSFAPASIAAGTSSTLTITLDNTHSTVSAFLSAALTDSLPSGMVVAAVPTASTTCTTLVGTPATVTAAAGESTLSLAAGSILPPSASCIVRVDVAAAAAGTYTNTIPAGALQTTNGNNLAAASAALTVTGGP